MDGKIKVKIDRLGNATVEGVGFTGGACKEASEAVEKALSATGGGATTTQYKPEFYQDDMTEKEHVRNW